MVRNGSAVLVDSVRGGPGDLVEETSARVEEGLERGLRRRPDADRVHVGAGVAQVVQLVDQVLDVRGVNIAFYMEKTRYNDASVKHYIQCRKRKLGLYFFLLGMLIVNCLKEMI